jgi:chemotaxis protein CheC
MIQAPSELQLDALREVANIGCGHAADALSKLVGGRLVKIEVPQVLVAGRSEMGALLGGHDAKVVTALLGLEGELSGKLVFSMPDLDARQLSGLLLGAGIASELGELEQSALAEAANIVTSACLNAVGRLARLKLLPTTPRLVRGVVAEVLAAAVLGPAVESGLLVVLEARFQTAHQPLLGGQLLVLADPPSLGKLLGRLGV